LGFCSGKSWGEAVPPGAEEPERAGTEAGLNKQNARTRMKRGLDKAFLTTLIK
jgi:hypothetical protein